MFSLNFLLYCAVGNVTKYTQLIFTCPKSTLKTLEKGEIKWGIGARWVKTGQKFANNLLVKVKQHLSES